MSRMQLNMNGSRPLADTGSGAAGELLGSERAKLQAMPNWVAADETKLDAIGTSYGVSLGSDVLLGNGVDTVVLSVASVPAGTYLIGAHVTLRTGPGGGGIGTADFRVEEQGVVNDHLSTSHLQLQPQAYASVGLGLTLVTFAATRTVRLIGKADMTSLFANATNKAGSGKATKLTIVRLA